MWHRFATMSRPQSRSWSYHVCTQNQRSTNTRHHLSACFTPSLRNMFYLNNPYPKNIHWKFDHVHILYLFRFRCENIKCKAVPCRQIETQLYYDFGMRCTHAGALSRTLTNVRGEAVFFIASRCGTLPLNLLAWRVNLGAIFYDEESQEIVKAVVKTDESMKFNNTFAQSYRRCPGEKVRDNILLTQMCTRILYFTLVCL